MMRVVSISAVAVITASVLLYYSNTDNFGGLTRSGNNGAPKIASFDFNYTEANKILKQQINVKGYNMSSPIRLSTKEDIKRYCEFFADPKKQELIKHCSSTEIKDKNNRFLGNIHMVGSIDKPQLVMSILETNNLSNIGNVKTVFSIVIDNMVCDCWEQVRPGNYTNVGSWITELKKFHSGGDGGQHSQTKVTLRDNVIQLELTSKEDNTYLWKLLISK